jgi:predicted acyl esterase
VVAVAAVLTAVPATASAAPPEPFGLACAPRASTLFCPAVGDSERVPSFDGTPIDVDVTLPATGDGPFPTLVMLHGFGGSKGAYTSADPAAGRRYNSTAFAQRGYAVVTPSIRGFGRSCGTPSSRTPDCANGYIRLADQRYEARDVQELLGRLVDQRVADPTRLAVTGRATAAGCP